MSILDKLLNVNETWIYVITLLIASAAIYIPPGPPEVISYTNNVYDYIENLEKDDTVCVTIGNSYAWFLSHLPAFNAVMLHLIDKEVNFIVFYHFNDGINCWQYDVYPAIKPYMDEKGYVYGEDYALMPFLPGEETAAAAFAQDVWTIPNDWYGTSFDDLPIMENIRTAEDWDCAIVGGWVHQWVVRQWWSAYDTDLIILGHPAAIGFGPTLVDAGQIVGFLAGWEGGAQYEVLIDKPGLGYKGSSIVSILYILCIVLVLAGNVVYFGKKYSGGN